MDPRITRCRVFFLFALPLAGLWAYACGDGTTEPTTSPPELPHPTTVAVIPATARLTALGASVQLSAQILDQNGQAMTGVTVTWASSHPAVATVSAAGMVTAVGNGTASIAASAAGASGTTTVTVAQEVSAVAVSPAADTLVGGDTLRLTAAATDANGHPVTEVEFSWASGDTAVVVVDDAGLVTGVGPGQAEVAATAAGVTGRAELTVVAPAPTASFTSPSQFVPEGGRAVLTVSLGSPPDSPVTVQYGFGIDDDIETDDADSSDYADSGAGMIRIPAGESSASIEIVINDDDEIEPTREVLTVVLHPPDATAGYILGSSSSATVTIQEGVCDRTPQVREEIMRLAGTGNCQDPDRTDLKGITKLEFFYRERWPPGEQEASPITALREGDFRGLSELTRLELNGTALTTLPAGVFSGLDELRTLWLPNNQLATLPVGVFSGLSQLGQLGLASNRLAKLPEGLFGELTSLWWLMLSDNPLAKLPPGIFSDLSSLEGLEMTHARLTELPAGVFVGLTNLTALDLTGNPGAPFALTLQPLRLDNENLLAPGPATVAVQTPEGAPFPIRVPLSVQGGDVTADTLTIGTGSAQSTQVTVTRNAAGAVGTQVALGPVPAVPERVRGIEIAAADPIVVFPALSPAVSLVSNAESAPEGGTVVLELELSAPASAPVTFTYTVGSDDDPATADADASDHAHGASNSIQVAAGASGGAIEIAINDDSDIEPVREVFTVTLDTPAEETGYARGFAHTALVTIEEGVCDRTPRVRDEIIAVTGSTDCAGTDERDLAGILRLDIKGDVPWDRSELGVVWTREFAARIRRDECELASWPFGSVAPPESVRCADADEPTARQRTRTSGSGYRNPVATLREGDFAGLSNLAVLDLVGLGLTELPSGVFAGLRKLYWLNLQFNELTSLPDGIFSDLTNLWEGLILADNRLTDLPESVFAGLFPETPVGGIPDVGFLILERNELTDLPPRLFEGLAGVDWLYLNGNGLTEVPSGAFSDLSALTVLNLAGNQLGTVPGRAFAELSNLRSLHLWENRLTSLPASALDGLSGLQRLLLGGNLLADLPAGGFSSVPQLTTLELWGNPLGAVEASAFSGTPNLESLHLASIQLTELSPGLFSHLPSLERLNLQSNELNELSAGAFVGLTRLEELKLDGNPGAPFSFALEPRRTDSGNLLAPGPATVRVALEPGAPFNMTIPLAVHGGSSSASVFVLEAGSDRSTEVTVSRGTAGEAGTQLVVGPAPRLPTGVTGIELEMADPLVLFATVSNHAPVAARQLPWLRMREGGEAGRVTVSSYFRDADGDELEFSAVSGNPGVATASVAGSRITVNPLAGGSASVTVTATDPGRVERGTLPSGIREGRERRALRHRPDSDRRRQGVHSGSLRRCRRLLVGDPGPHGVGRHPARGELRVGLPGHRDRPAPPDR